MRSPEEGTPRPLPGRLSLVLRWYLRGVYQDAVKRAYDRALEEVASTLSAGGRCLDCGASDGYVYDKLQRQSPFSRSSYVGVEWDRGLAAKARARGVSVVPADLNRGLPFRSEAFECVFALSSLEHLLNGCRFLGECRRVLRPGGRLVLLTPNIATFFSIFQLLLGRMPSSGPHPDSNALLRAEEPLKVSADGLEREAESETPQHRHLVVFSFLVLRRYLGMLGFSSVLGYGYGLYPFPRAVQPLLERLDPYHCHQMVFVASK